MNRSLKHLMGAQLPAMLLLSTMTACAARHIPAEEIGAARMAIEQAEREVADPYSGSQLVKAREKLGLARSQESQGNYTLARRLAEQASVDANLARAIAADEKEKAMAREAIAN